MSFSSVDDLVTKYTSGKSQRIDWNKTTTVGITYSPARWYDFSPLAGYPIANAWAGTSLAWTSCNELAGNGTQIFGIPHAGNVSTDTKHILNASAYSSAATGTGMMMLVDLQGYWPGINMNSASPQNLTGTPTLRYANGEGCRLYFVTTATAGATVQNLSISYTNQGGTPSRSMPTAVSMVPSSVVGHLSHSQAVAYSTTVPGMNFGPFLPLASGDTGIANVASVTFSAAAGGGTGALCLARPLLTLPLMLAGVSTERDYLNQMTTLPRVMDGACLVWLFYAGQATAASSLFAGSLEYVWG